MKKKIFIAFLIVVAMVGLTAMANANSVNIIYDNGAPDQVQGWESAQWVSADDFTLPKNSWITDAHFWTGEYADNWDGTLDYYIFADNGGAPGASPIYSGSGQNISKTFTGVVFNGANEFYYEFDTETPLYLLGNTTYWFALHLASGFPYLRIHWETTGTYSGDNMHSSLGGTFDNWVGTWPYDLAFQLTGEPVPEPATMFLLGTGLVGVAGAARRKKKNQA